jgi:hypothetical protein
MLTHAIDAPLPEPNSTIVLYFYSNDFPSVDFAPINIIENYPAMSKNSFYSHYEPIRPMIEFPISYINDQLLW